MRHLVIIWSLLTISVQVNAQKKEKAEDEKLFDKAYELYENEELDSALFVFRQFRSEYKNSDLIPRVHYNIAFILKERQQIEDAKVVFKEIIESKYNEKDPGGHGLMGPQYALYKHFSCEQLAGIYIQEKNFEEAEKYVRLFDKKYPYEHFCGNELVAYQIFKAQNYAKVYDGQGKIDKAINQLIPHTFYTGLAENDELIKDLISFLDKRYSIEEIRIELRRSISSLKRKNSNKQGETWTIKLYKFNLDVDENGLFSFTNTDDETINRLEGREKYLKVIQTNGLYKHYGIE